MAKQFDFEEAFRKLEDIVQDLESGSLGLEQAIKKFKLGSSLAQECLKQLQSVKIKVEQVVGEEKGKLKTKAFPG